MKKEGKTKGENSREENMLKAISEKAVHPGCWREASVAAALGAWQKGKLGGDRGLWGYVGCGPSVDFILRAVGSH